LTAFREGMGSCLLAAAAAVVLAPAALSGEIIAEILPRAEVKGGFVRLGDVARITAEPQATAGALAGVLLGRSPERGGLRIIPRDYILERLLNDGIGLDSLQLVGAEAVRVESAAGEKRPAAPAPSGWTSGAKDCLWGGRGQLESLSDTEREGIERGIARLAARESGFQEDAIEVSLKSVMLAAAAPAAGTLRASTLTGGRSLGSVKVALVGSFGGVEEPAGTASAEVTAKVRALGVSRPVASGEVLSEGDLAWVTVSVRGGREGCVTDPQLVLGRETTKALGALEPLDAGSLRKQGLVKRGEMVTVVASAGGIRVTDTAVAAGDGSAGDVVQVTNSRSGGAFSAQVVGPRLVRLLDVEEAMAASFGGKSK